MVARHRQKSWRPRPESNRMGGSCRGRSVPHGPRSLVKPKVLVEADGVEPPSMGFVNPASNPPPPLALVPPCKRKNPRKSIHYGATRCGMPVENTTSGSPKVVRVPSWEVTRRMETGARMRQLADERLVIVRLNSLKPSLPSRIRPIFHSCPTHRRLRVL